MTPDPKPPREPVRHKRPPLTIEGAATEIPSSSSTVSGAAGPETSAEPYGDIGAESAGRATSDDATTAGAEASSGATKAAADPTASPVTSEISPEEQAVAASIDIRPGDDADPVLSDADPAAAENEDAVLDLRPGAEPSLSGVHEGERSDASPSAPIHVRPDPSIDANGGSAAAFAEPEDAESPPPPTPRRRGGFFSHMGAGLLGGMVGVLSAALIWPLIAERLQIDAASPQVEQMDERLTRLEAQSQQPAELEAAASLDVGTVDGRIEEKLAPIREQVAGLGQAGPAPSGEQLAALEARVDAIAKAEPQAAPDVEPKITALDQRAAALDQRVAALESKLPDVAAKISANAAESRNAALAIAVANLRGAVASGRPYRNELDALKALAKGGLDLDALEARAGNGVPSPADIEQRFAASVPAAKKAEAKTIDEDRSWGGRLVDNARSLVKVKRNGEGVEGAPTAAALDRAADWLKGGDLAQAVREVEQLQGPAAAAMNGWLGSARARLGAEDALGRLQQSTSTTGSVGSRR